MQRSCLWPTEKFAPFSNTMSRSKRNKFKNTKKNDVSQLSKQTNEEKKIKLNGLFSDRLKCKPKRWSSERISFEP